MSALPLGRYRQLLHQLLQLNEQAAALRRELTAIVDTGVVTEPTEGAQLTAQPENVETLPKSKGESSADSERNQINNGALVDSWGSMESSNSPLSDYNSPQRKPDLSKSKHNNLNGNEKSDSLNHNESHSGFRDFESANTSYGKPRNATTGQRESLLELEETDIINDDECSSYTRKPHFLDEDYHLKSSDACRILKPHFLDQSLSPDDEKLLTVKGLPVIEDDSRDLASNGNITDVRDTPTNQSKIEELSSSNGHSFKNDLLHQNFMMSSQASTSNRYCPQSYESGWQMDKEFWQSQDSCSVKSFSSAGSGNFPKMGNLSQQIGPKVDCVYSLLSLLSLSADCNADMSDYLLKMSDTIESCIAMRQSGCIPLLVQLIHSKHSRTSKNKAAQALHNMIHALPDDKSGRREVRVLRLLEHVRDYCHFLEDLISARKEICNEAEDDMAKHPVQSVAALMKLSFDEEHRHVMCQLGGLQSLASLVTVDQSAHGSLIEDIQCVTMRKYSGMALTNLTFGDGNNKALLCSFKDFMISLVDQLQSPNDDMRQVTAAVLRNLSWRADSASKQILREVGAVKGLTMAAMTGHKEATLKSVLSALWNLTAHCSLNKVDICSVDGALAFLVKMLSFDAPSKTLAIIENAGGILRNVSSHIAVREDYRQILREHNCLKVLLQQLKSPSLTIVSNSCGTLWNLSARCQQDQQYLWDHGAIPMLRSLIHSKHKMIAMGSSAALKNLLNSKPGKNHIKALDSTARDLNLPLLPTLGARKQKALEQELDQNLSETCENIEPNTSPTTSNRDEKLLLSAAERQLAMSLEKRRMSSSSPLIGHLTSQISLSHSAHFANSTGSGSGLLQSGSSKSHIYKTMRSGNVNRSESKDSVTSTHSDSVYERISRSNKFPHFSDYSRQIKVEKNRGSCSAVNTTISKADFDFIKRYSRADSLIKYDCIQISNPTDIARNNYSESGFDIEPDGCDQPIDYSQKYSETKSSHNTINESPGSKFTLPDNFSDSKDKINIANHSRSPMFHIKEELNVMQTNETLPNKVNTVFGDYQETDLDQPTDYSLRYAEDDSDIVSIITEPQAISAHEDTIKHFCTEGTPYETPINFSTATSMSDLRTIGAGAPVLDKSVEKDKKDEEKSPILKEGINVMSQSDERDTCSLEENTKHNNDDVITGSITSKDQPSTSAVLVYNSKFSSGMLSPEKPVNYCEEGTPGYFSRVSSLSSLGDIGEDIRTEDKWAPEKESSNEKHFDSSITENVNDELKEEDESKTPPLENNLSGINYAEETPLMFSRSSSLGSLSECSVPDQPDDVGSVVSEFSRLTSGCISPSELPDSPTQSPLPKVDVSNISAPNRNKHFKLPIQPTNRLHSVFEDEVSTFKFEHTPIEFSTGTSLSSLTIDDELGVKTQFTKPFNIEKRSEGVGCSDPDQDQVVPLQHNDGSINLGASSKSRITNTSAKPLVSSQNVHDTEENLNSDSHILTDTCRTYYTEDTPALLSKVGSQSDLSILSISEIDHSSTSSHLKRQKELISTLEKKDYSDDSSNLSGESDNLLAECIRSGMPKTVLPAYLLAQDETENYAVEGSPFQHSPCSSLSDLTIGSKNNDHKARLVKSFDLDSSPKKGKNQAKQTEQGELSTQQGSLAGSLSSVSLGSDDGHLLDMAIRAGVPQQNDESNSYGSGRKFNKSEKNSVASKDQKKSANLSNYTVDDKSEDHITVLTRNDSLSSLSVDSLGSNEGEQALFEQCIKSGMPKVQTSHKWDEVHAKTLDKNFKARSSDRHKPDLPRYQNRIHRSLERTGSERDTEFENLVTAGAFGTCYRKLSKTEENINDKALLKEAIYCGIPKKRDKGDKGAMELLFKNMTIKTNPKNDSKSENINFNDSKNVQVTSAVANNGPSAPLNTSALTAAADVKTTKTPEDIRSADTDSQLTPNSTLEALMILDLVIKEQADQDVSDKNLLSNGITSKSSPYNSTAKNGSEKDFIDECDGNSTSVSASDTDINGFKSANTCENRAAVSSMYPTTKQMIVSNQCDNDLSSEEKFYKHTITQNISETGDTSKSYSFKFISASELDSTTIESITDRDMCSSLGKADKHSSDTWNENTCPNDVSFPTVSGSIPMITSYKSEVADEITCATGLPDLLEESIILSESINQPDLTNRLNKSMHNKVCDDFTSQENMLSKSLQITKKASESDKKLSVGNQDNEQTESQMALSINESLCKFPSMSNSTMIENEATRLALLIKKDTLDYSMCLTESGHSMYSLDLDNVKPPSQMGSLVSLTQSLSGNWDDSHSDNPECDRQSSLMKKSIQNSYRKKSLPQGIMVRKALGLPLVNQENPENLDAYYSNLENIKPPSEMEDIFDMENSMLSVASIVSEEADSNRDLSSMINFDFKQPTNGLFAANNMFTSGNIENVNPPSLFDEITESTLEMGNENFDYSLTQTLHYKDADTGNSMASDGGISSLESTPKKKKLNRESLTPKQRRQLSRDRYKTYTIAAELELNSDETAANVSEDLSDGDKHLARSSGVEEKRTTGSPKLRRQEDRARYQTQTVNISDLNLITRNINSINENAVLESRIEVIKKKMEAKKTIKQKRLENSERYRTRTLEGSIHSSPESSSNEFQQENQSKLENCPQTTNSVDSFHSQFVEDASKAFDFLQKQTIDDTSYVDLECETISLISEDDSELNSLRMKTITRSFRNYLPVIESPTSVDKCIEKNLKNINISCPQEIIDMHNITSTDVNEKLTVTSDFNSSECEQNSGTESADQNHYSDSETEFAQTKGKPKISKPDSVNSCFGSNSSVNLDESAPKTIRGRRKGLYVSPYKRNDFPPKKSPARYNGTAKANKSSTNISPKGSHNLTTKTPIGLKKPINLIAKNTPMTLKSNTKNKSFDKTGIKAKVNGSNKNKNSQNICETVSETKTSPLVRQGTFVKEESTVLQYTSPGIADSKKTTFPTKSTKPTAIKQPLNSSPSRLPQPSLKNNLPKPSLKKTTSIESNISGGRTSSNLNIKNPKSTIKYSSSNQSLQSNDSSKTVKINSKNKSPKYNAAPCPGSGSSTSKAKDTASKVANLWKKVEESKINSKPDSRVWIARDSSVDAQETKTKLIRSSTFEGSSKTVSSIPTPLKQKSSINIKDSQSPNFKYSSKVPVVKSTTKYIGIVNTGSK